MNLLVIFDIAQAMMTKHFKQWIQEYFCCCLEDDHPSAKYVANWLLGNEEVAMANIPQEYSSTKHKTKINVLECGQFLDDNQSPGTHQEK